MTGPLEGKKALVTGSSSGPDAGFVTGTDMLVSSGRQ
jgi:hypothetical protein